MKNVVFITILIFSVTLCLRANTLTAETTVLFEDNFQSIDTDLWNIYDDYGQVSIDTGSTISNDGYSLHIQSSGSRRVAVRSKQTFSPNMYNDPDGVIILTIGGPLLKWWEQQQKAYLADFVYNDGYIQEDAASNNSLGIYTMTNSKVSVSIADSVNRQFLETDYYIGSTYDSEPYKMYWYNSGKFVVTKGNTQIFDSTAQSPVWSLPLSEQSLPIWLVNGNTSFPTITDYVKVEYASGVVNIDVDVSIRGMLFTEYDRAFDPHYFGFTNNALVAESLDDLKDDGFEIARFNAVLSSADMYNENTPLDEYGNPIFDFSYIDNGLDPIVALGFKPQLLMCYMPPIISVIPDQKEPEYYWKNTGECADYDMWETMIVALVSHFQDRYGADEVATWLFGVWNEADFGAYGAYDGQANLLKLYDHTIKAVKSVDSRIRVGGPGTVTSTYKRGGGSWIVPEVPQVPLGIENPTKETAPDWSDSVDHWATGTNYATSQTGTPVDYISSHMYEWGSTWTTWQQGFPGTYEFACQIFDFMMETVRSYSEFSDIPVVIDEWEGAPEKKGEEFLTHPMDGAYVAARQIQIMDAARRRGLAGMFHHCQTQVPSTENKLFAGFPALYTLQGPIRTAPGSALRLYNQLQGRQVDVQSRTHNVSAIAALDEDNDILRVIVYSCDDDWFCSGNNEVNLNVSWYEARNLSVDITKKTVDPDNANPRKRWEQLGKPNTVVEPYLSQLKAAAIIPTSSWQAMADGDGMISLETNISRPGVQYFEIKLNTIISDIDGDNLLTHTDLILFTEQWLQSY